uniref:Uncharacterized protein n=1 Tax=Sparus aurata TaxID=8175 RepID=A0A671TKU2_SPAAU
MKQKCSCLNTSPAVRHRGGFMGIIKKEYWLQIIQGNLKSSNIIFCLLLSRLEAQC